jgi:hypothetical protein
MSDRAPYSRVYWSVLEDDKFDGIREDCRHLGTWTLLLVLADMAWPAPAYLPQTASKPSVTALVTAGLVDVLGGGRFRIHGLDAERGRRSESARVAGLASGRSRTTGTDSERSLNGRSRTVEPTGTERGTENQPRRDKDETSLDETRQDEDRDALDRFYELTQWNPWTLEWRRDELTSLQSDYGIPATVAALDAEWANGQDRKTLTKRAAARLARDNEHAKEAARAARKSRPRIVVDDAVLAHALGEDIA